MFEIYFSVGMLVPSPKYNVEEIELSSYRYISILRMSALEADDFDEYKCVSENTIGRSEAVMNVYGKTGSKWLILFVKIILLCLWNNNETYCDFIEIEPEIETQSTETHHISNTYLNEYGVEDDDERSESNEVDDVESDEYWWV